MVLVFHNGVVVFDLRSATQHFLDARMDENDELHRDGKLENLIQIGKSFITHIDYEPPGTQSVAGWFFRVYEEEEFDKIDLWETIELHGKACPPRTCAEMTKLRYLDLLDWGSHMFNAGV